MSQGDGANGAGSVKSTDNQLGRPEMMTSKIYGVLQNSMTFE